MASKPLDGWQDLFMGRVEAELAKRPNRDRNARPHRDYRARLPLSSAALLVTVATRRGLSVSAYLRRAALAFIAYDLGMDLSELLADEPTTRGKFDGPKSDEVAGLRAHGAWVIMGLEDVDE